MNGSQYVAMVERNNVSMNENIILDSEPLFFIFNHCSMVCSLFAISSRAVKKHMIRYYKRCDTHGWPRGMVDILRSEWIEGKV